MYLGTSKTTTALVLDLNDGLPQSPSGLTNSKRFYNLFGNNNLSGSNKTSGNNDLSGNNNTSYNNNLSGNTSLRQ